jgi:ribosomal protein S18 acetylase RimI-like enzyme
MLRDFHQSDAAQLNRVALAAFEQFAPHYSDWPAMSRSVGQMAELAKDGEIIVASRDDQILGGVVYIPPAKPKAGFFDPAWPVMRMLVVDPAWRGGGIGRTLAQECVRRARRDGSPVIALHTSPIMTVALAMYVRMGFELIRDAPPIHGVPYGVYVKQLP